MPTVRDAVAVRDAAAVPAKVTPRDAIRHTLEANAGAIAASLPTGFSPERFTRLLLTAVNVPPA